MGAPKLCELPLPFEFAGEKFRRGDHFRIRSGGDTFHRPTSKKFARRGYYEFRRAFRKGKRLYVSCVELIRIGDCYTYDKTVMLYVSGAPYKSESIPGVTHRAHKIVKLKERKPLRV